jgi:hypothetical protein
MLVQWLLEIELTAQFLRGSVRRDKTKNSPNHSGTAKIHKQKPNFLKNLKCNNGQHPDTLRDFVKSVFSTRGRLFIGQPLDLTLIQF